MKKIVLVLLILVVIGGTAFSFDIHSFPDPIQKNSILLSPTFHFGFSGVAGWSSYSSLFSFGLTVAADYALPIPVALAVGLEFGFASNFEDFSDGVTLPILVRVSWHPNFEVRGLDPYVTMKLGYSIGVGNWGYESKYWSSGGFSYGFNVGCRYFFNDIIGIFGELGYDRYAVGSYDFDYGFWGSRDYYTYYYYAFFHFGVTFRLGGDGGSSSSSRSSSSSSRSSGRYVVNVDSLNVRSGPSADNSLVGSLPRGTRVEVLNNSGTWWEIRSGSVRGYVNSSYLKED